MDDDVTALDPDTGEEIEDITPGAESPSELYHDVDAEFAYDTDSETWIGEPARVELRIETVNELQVKRFVLAEPDDETMDQLVTAVLNGNEFEFCTGVVKEPELTAERWRSSLTGRERKLLFDHAFAWLRFGEFVSMQRMRE